MTEGPPDLPGVSIVILNWNGVELLEACLPSIVEAAGRYAEASQVVVVDNGSTDGSLELLRASFPTVEVLSLGENLGFPKGCNRGVSAATHPVVILLNNDVAVEPDFIPPLVRVLREHPDAFAVTPRMDHWDRRRTFCTAIGGELRQGRLVQIWALDGNHRDLCGVVAPTLYTCGAAMAFRREAFHDLGGFDELYQPFYWEDTDLAYRAWKRGQPSWYQPESRVYHMVSATMRKSSVPWTFFLRRNRYLFHWRNLTDAGLLAAHIATLPWEVLRSSWAASRQNGTPWTRELLLELRALVSASALGGAVLARRRADRRHRRWSDAEVLSRSDWRSVVPDAPPEAFQYR